MEQSSGIDTLFVLLGAIMALAMHAGFAFLEVGTVRRKNQVNALVKIITDCAASTIAYFFIGYALAYGVGFFDSAEALSANNGYDLVKFFFLFDRSAGDWFSFKKDKAQSGFAPFIGYFFGAAFYPTVEWVDPDNTVYPRCNYWDGGIILMQNILLGAEYRFSPSMGLFLELGIATFGAPNASSDDTANNVNEAGYMMTFPIRLGLVITF